MSLEFILPSARNEVRCQHVREFPRRSGDWNKQRSIVTSIRRVAGARVRILGLLGLKHSAGWAQGGGYWKITPLIVDL